MDISNHYLNKRNAARRLRFFYAFILDKMIPSKGNSPDQKKKVSLHPADTQIKKTSISNDGRPL